MQERENKLAVSLVAVLVVIGGYVFIEGKWTEFDALGKRRDSSKSNLEHIRVSKAAGDAAVRRLDNWHARSLPPAADDAQRLYQAWLTDLAQMCGIDAPKVTPGRQLPKGKTYVAVQVVVEGQATLDRLARFSYRFDRTDLPHRIVRLNFASTGSEGDPLLTFKLTAEALSVPTAKPRDVLFPQTTLVSDLAADATTMTVSSSAGFPKRGKFRVRIGNEFVTAEADKKNARHWTLTRAVDETNVAAYSEKAIVELAPLIETKDALTFKNYRSSLKGNPFVKARSFRPELSPIGDQIVERGKSLEFKVGVRKSNVADKPFAFSLQGDLPPGMTVDAASGQLSWTPAEEQPVGEWDLVLNAAPARKEQPTLSEKFKVTFKEPSDNHAPVLETIAAQTVFLGETLTFTVKGTDPDGDRVAYYLKEESEDDGAPSIDADSGEFFWTPVDELFVGEHEITVEVWDGGELSDKQVVMITIDDNVAEFTYLVASIATDDDREAWLYDRSQNKHHILQEGKTVKVGGMELLVMEIAGEFTILKRKGDLYRLKLGRNLRTMEKLAKAKDAASKDTAAKDALPKVVVPKDPAEAPAPSQPKPEAKTAEKPAS
jgi:hypothetical protein